jgi:hypothetical protein
MKERDIKKLAIELLDKLGYFYWFPHNTWGERDIFGVFDFCAVSKFGHFMFVQITTIDHISHRRHKIQNFFSGIGAPVRNAYIWAWDKKKERFKIEKVV